jgi:hypothetical protein
MGGMVSLPEIHSQMEKETCINTRLNKQRESSYLEHQDSVEYRHTIESIPFQTSPKRNYDRKFPVRLPKETFIKKEALFPKHRPFFYNTGKAWTSYGYKEGGCAAKP